jgi:predicted nucleotidyltransferase
MHKILQGVVGSTAYGLATENSDVDQIGIFACDTVDLFGLKRVTDSVVTHEPDLTLHEVAKYCRLALAGNPTIMELMWLPNVMYTCMTPLGEQLIRIRGTFLSAPNVRNAYLGYATQQFHKLEARSDGSFSADLRKRTAKHARHLLRLCRQGYTLYTTGRLEIVLEHPEDFHEFGERIANGDIELARRELKHYQHAFDVATPMVPDKPDPGYAERWLRSVRREFYE